MAAEDRDMVDFSYTQKLAIIEVLITPSSITFPGSDYEGLRTIDRLRRLA
jgi:hypothetical protein